MSRRRAHRHSSATPLGPTPFVRRLPQEIGTPRAKRLVLDAMKVVQATGKPDAWIRELQRGRDRGAISHPIARFLIFKLVESAITPLIDLHPRLAPITREIQRVESEHGLEEGEYWLIHEGPPEWQALNREWDAATDAIMAEIFLRHHELELAANPQGEGDPLLEEGRVLLFPPDADSSASSDDTQAGVS